MKGYTAEEIAEGLGRGEILAYFQPQIDVTSGAIVAAEALSRWRHPTDGLVFPDEYIPTAERVGLIADIDRRMLALACEHVREWDAAGMPVGVSVNVSASRVAAGGLREQLLDCVEATGIDPGRLTVEITESQAITAVDGARELLSSLVEHGFGVSIDDFGTGHADAALLEVIPATEIKIDRSLMQQEDPADAASAAALAHERGLRLVAEGVATLQQWRLASDLGCHRVQGFLVAEALTPTRMLQVLTARRR